MNLNKLSAFMQIVCFVELSALNLENQLSALRFLAVFQNVCLFKADDDSMVCDVILYVVRACLDQDER